MASTPTDPPEATGRAPRPPSPAPRHAPAPLAPDAAARVPGVLGRIVAERIGDYRDPAAPDGPLAAPPPPGENRAAPPRPTLRGALATPGVAVIAEIKRSSPSQGVIDGAVRRLGPVAAAGAYQRAGAAAISVLTEPRHFGGALEHLGEIAATTRLPLLRKDFVVHPRQVLEARERGASAALLIVAALGERTADYLEWCRRCGLDALVEIHDEAELDLALAAGADLLGVNNRDLTTLEIDLETAPRLIERARAAGFTGLAVAESGYRHPAEIAELRGVADAVLVGTSVAGSGDLEAGVGALVDAGREAS